ncbi:uncharacterized protein METZ01_LOCUS323122 [marine metagenome]|uniref:Uncharacterized protein n=1 Tax=marine metagenome TaxID=408172 RepID=A0A382PC04_9ZZZZ
MEIRMEKGRNQSDHDSGQTFPDGPAGDKAPSRSGGLRALTKCQAVLTVFGN